MLRWHYRSKHDSLINFSNERFYGRRLFLFPSSRKEDEALGLKFVHVSDGVYNRGSTRNNPQEAEVVADQVFDHLARHPEKSLGVVTFNISQMNTIQDILESRLSKSPEYQRFFVEDRLHGFFVKNLENVQGDERDVMILSVGYGYDRNGNFTMNFGPLNKHGGERRLNVAITRAREKVILVSSIKSSDINLSATKAAGVQSLYHYLMYAEKGTGTDSEEYAQVKYWSPITWDVGEEIRRLGFWVTPRVGSSSFRVDLGVIDPKYLDRYIMGILFDGDTYRSASTARDRDRLRESILENLGWRIHRIWSPDWVQRRETELMRLEEALRDLSTRRPKKKRTSETQRQISEQSHTKEVIKNKVKEINRDRLPEVVPYRPSKLRPRHLFSRYSPEFNERYLGQYRSEVQRLLPVIVITEGPIHLEYALKRINTCLRLRRTTSTFKNIFKEVLDDFKREGKIVVQGEFLWPNTHIDVNVRIPVEGIEDTFRPVKYIPLDEIRSALTLISTHSLGLIDESLIKETARLLGFKRMGIKVKAVLQEALQSLIDEGVLTYRDGCLTRSDGE
jgi:hypothetical protein